MRDLAAGRRATLVTDPTQDRFDRYGRFLAYLYVRQRNLDLVQIRRGWGYTYVYEQNPFRQVASFRVAEAEARSDDRGVWARCDGNFPLRRRLATSWRARMATTQLRWFLEPRDRTRQGGRQPLMQECSLNVTLQGEDVRDSQTVLAAVIDSTARIVETGLWEGPVFNAQGDQIGTYRLTV